MSQSKTSCPHCGRPPGGRHSDPCPRSRASLRELDRALRILAARPALWAKGSQIALATGEHVVNPGIPYVDPEGGKPWYAGGVPAIMRRNR